MGRGIQAPCEENILSLPRQHRSIHCNWLFVSFHCQWRFTFWSTVSQLASCHVVFSCRSHLMMCIIHHTSSNHHLYPSPSIKHDWNHWMLKVPCQEMFQELVQSQSAGSSVESNMDAYVVMGMLGCLFGGSSIHWMIWVFPKERRTPPALENTVKTMLWSNPHKIGKPISWKTIVHFLSHRKASLTFLTNNFPYYPLPFI